MTADGVEPCDCECPWCWEKVTFYVDLTAARQEYTEDCEVCCKPVIVTVEVDEEEDVHVAARRED